MKKRIFALLAIIFILFIGFMEFRTPLAEASNTYTVLIKTEGKPVKKAEFKGYQFTEPCRLTNGKIKTVRFFTEKPLKVNAKYKIIVQGNQLIVQAKKLGK